MLWGFDALFLTNGFLFQILGSVPERFKCRPQTGEHPTNSVPAANIPRSHGLVNEPATLNVVWFGVCYLTSLALSY